MKNLEWNTLDSINNIYMEPGKENNCRDLIIISEVIKHNFDTYRAERIDRKWERAWSKFKFKRVKTCKHILRLFSNHRRGTAFPSPSMGHFFHPVMSTAWAITDLREERIWPIYNTVDSPLFPGSLRGHSLYAIIWPLVIPLTIITSTGKDRWILDPSI